MSGAGLCEMRRVRMLENNWTRGNGLGFAVTRNRAKVYAGHGGSYPGYITTTLIDVNAKVGVMRFVEQNGQVVRMITGDSYVERVRE